MVFIENYDMNVARYLVQGVDVWLNTPRRPYEASGTSGMKAAANGVLNCSILDGWWVEGYSPDVGWAIGRGESYTDPGYQDHVESQALYDLLEKQIMPLFYHRTTDNLPREWIARMKNCMRKLRRLQHQSNGAGLHADVLPAGLHPRAGAGSRWDATCGVRWPRQGFAAPRWNGIRIVGVHTSGNGHFKVGDTMQVEAMVDLPGIDPKELTVQLYTGPVSAKAKSNARRRWR